jgi:hypothetical protein
MLDMESAIGVPEAEPAISLKDIDELAALIDQGGQLVGPH